MARFRTVTGNANTIGLNKADVARADALVALMELGMGSRAEVLRRVIALGLKAFLEQPGRWIAAAPPKGQRAVRTSLRLPDSTVKDAESVLTLVGGHRKDVIRRAVSYGLGLVEEAGDRSSQYALMTGMNNTKTTTKKVKVKK